MNKYLISIMAAFVFLGSNVKGQTYNELLGQDEINAITTSVPFLLISPDARGGSMGDVGVSTTVDVNSQHWNPAKYPFSEKQFGLGISYSPWLPELVDDINLGYLAGYYKLNKLSAISGSLRYFTLGEIQFTDRFGGDRGMWKPNEFALDVAYSRFLGDNLTGAVAFRYIRSDLTQGQTVGGAATTAGEAVASDVAIYYNNEVELFDTEAEFAFGVNISNLGSKISYSETLERDFIPTNLRLGPSINFKLDEYNKLAVMLEVNKLLVPTPPVYATDSNGTNILNPDGSYKIESGMDPTRGTVDAIFTSFSDAPGGFKEEMREFYYSIAAEYVYDDMFMIRGGYFHEHETKGNRKFFTLGVGFKYTSFNLDISYLIPTTQRNPLEHTLRFSLLFEFDEVTFQE